MVPWRFAFLSLNMRAAGGMLQQGGAVAAKAGGQDVGVGDVGVGDAFRSVSSHVEELQAQLTRMEVDNRRQQAQRTQEYEEELGIARRENLQVAAENARLVQEIQQSQASARLSLSQALDLRQDVQSLHEDFKSLETNFTTALEVTGKVLKGVRELDRAPELRVLEELNEKDRGIGEAEQHHHRFDEILNASSHPARQPQHRNKKYALLQQATPGAAHGALLATLEAGLQDLTAENKRALRALDTKYRALLKEEADRHAGLLSEQKMLDGKKTQIKQLAVQLESVIAHLQGLHSDTSRQAASVRAYFAQVGGRSLPAKSNVAAEVEVKESSTEPVTTSTTSTVAATALAISSESPSSREMFEISPSQEQHGNKDWLKWLTR